MDDPTTVGNVEVDKDSELWLPERGDERLSHDKKNSIVYGTCDEEECELITRRSSVKRMTGNDSPIITIHVQDLVKRRKFK